MGAGFAGLVAAWDLSRKAYPVTVFHTGTAAEFLLARYPALVQGPASGISKDFAAEDMVASQKSLLSDQPAHAYQRRLPL